MVDGGAQQIMDVFARVRGIYESDSLGREALDLWWFDGCSGARGKIAFCSKEWILDVRLCNDIRSCNERMET